MTASMDLKREDFFLDAFLETKIVPLAPDRKQAVIPLRPVALR